MKSLVLPGSLMFRNRQKILGALTFIIAGSLIGIAWQGIFSIWFGVAGQAMFFAGLVICHSRWVSLLGSILCGAFGTLVSCGMWLPDTIEYLVNGGETLSYLLLACVCLGQSLPYLCTAIIWRFFRRLKHGWILLPSVWCLVDFLLPELYPIQLGHLLADSNAISQLSELGGVHLLTVLAAHFAVLPAMFFFSSIKSFQEEPGSVLGDSLNPQMAKAAFLGVFCVVVFASFFWGEAQFEKHSREWSLKILSTDKLELMIVQAETERASSNRRMIKATRQANGKADLIVWPESALGNYDRRLTSFSNPEIVKQNSKGKGSQFRPLPNPSAPLLAGASTWGKNDDGSLEYFVSAFLIDESELLTGCHDKIKLMPYGEYIPGESILPQLRTWFGGSKTISRGESIEPIGEIKGWNVGTVLCCEDMYPELCRSLTNQKSDILISIGNMMAFSSEPVLHQHFRIARLRAVENRRPFVRCMNRGISAVVSPAGTVMHHLPTLSEGAMLVSVPRTSNKTTLFTKYGSLPSWLFCISICLVGTLQIAQGRRNANSE